MSQEQYLAVYFNYAYTLKNNESTEKCQFQTLYIFFSLFTRLLQECRLQLLTS